MKIFNHSTWPTNAISYYRSQLPLECVSKHGRALGDPIQVIVDQFHPGTKPGARLINLHSADIVQCAAAVGVQVYESFGSIIGAIPMWTGEQVKTTPAMVLDVDDLYHEIGHTNPAFSMWGVHKPDGSLMGVDDEIVIETDDGPVILWKEGQRFGGSEDAPQLFSLAENHQRLAVLHRLLGQADMVTFSTEEVKKQYESYGVTFKDSHIHPNSIDVDEWAQVEFQLAPTDEIRIMWQGGWSHADDLFSIRDSLVRILKKYPKVKLVMFGHPFQWFDGSIPEGQLERHVWVNYDMYKIKLSTLNADINLAPLLDTNFNRCKTPIKFYEAAMCAKKTPTVAANVGPYKEIKSGETGLLYDTMEEFEAQVCALIENVELRKTMGEAARKWVVENRSTAVTTPGLYEAYKRVSDRVKSERRHFIPKNGEFDFGILAANHAHMGPSKNSCCPGCRVPV